MYSSMYSGKRTHPKYIAIQTRYMYRTDDHTDTTPDTPRYKHRDPQTSEYMDTYLDTYRNTSAILARYKHVIRIVVRKLLQTRRSSAGALATAPQRWDNGGKRHCHCSKWNIPPGNARTNAFFRCNAHVDCMHVVAIKKIRGGEGQFCLQSKGKHGEVPQLRKRKYSALTFEEESGEDRTLGARHGCETWRGACCFDKQRAGEAEGGSW